MSEIDHAFLNGIGSSSTKSSSLPLQHLEQSKKNKDWVKTNLDTLERIGIRQLHRNMEFNDYYKMISGEMVCSDYGLPDITKDIADLRGQVGLPTHAKHYDFLGIIVNQIRGEYIKLKDTYRVDTVDQQSQNDFIREKGQKLKEWSQEMFNVEIEKGLAKQGFAQKDKFQSEEEQQQYLQELEQRKANIVSPEVIEKQMAKSWKTIAAEWAEATLEYDRLRTDFNLDGMEEEEIVDYILTGRWFRHYHIGYDYYMPEKWDVRTTFFSEDVNVKYPQDCEYVGRINYISVSDCLNRYGDKISAETQKRLGGYYNRTSTESAGGADGSSSIQNILSSNTGQNQIVPFKDWYDYDITLQLQDAFDMPLGETEVVENGITKKVPSWFSPVRNGSTNQNTFRYARELRNDIDVRSDLLQTTEAYWRSWKRMGIINYTTPDGIPASKLVTDDLLEEFLKENNIKKLNRVSLEEIEKNPQPNTICYTWMPEIRWGVKISSQNSYLLEDLYIGGEPIECQVKGGISNIFNVQIPVAGYIGNSLAKKLRPYIIKHNIVLNQIYSLLEKELGQFLLFDIHFLPSEYKDNVSTKETLEMLYESIREVGIAPIDTSKQNMQGTNNGMNMFMNSQLDYTGMINNRMALAQQFKMQALEQIGMTPQRLGQGSEYATATGVREGMTATYAQTDPIFSIMSEATKKATELHLTVAQYCQKNYKDYSFLFVKSDGDKAFINLNDENFPLRDFGVFAQNNTKTKRELETLKETIFKLNTQNNDIQDLAEVRSSDSIQSLIAIGKRQREEKEKAIQADRQHQAELQDKDIQARAEQSRLEREAEEASKDKDRASRERQSYLTALGRATDKKSDQDGMDAIREAYDAEIKTAEFSLKERQTSAKEGQAKAKLDFDVERLKLEREKIAQNERKMQNERYIAERNKN